MIMPGGAFNSLFEMRPDIFFFVDRQEVSFNSLFEMLSLRPPLRRGIDVLADIFQFSI